MDDNTIPLEAAPLVLARLRSRTAQGVDRRQQLVTDLEAQVGVLKSEAKRLRQIEVLLENLLAASESGHWCDVLRQLDRAKDLGSALDQFSTGTSREIESVRTRAIAGAEEALNELSSSLPADLEGVGLHLDPSSRFPVFKLRNGFFEVKINKPKYEAQITTRHGSTIKVAADVSLIVTAVESENARCFGALPDSAEFSTRLRTAYLERTGPEKARPLPLEEVRQAFAEPIPPRDEFAVALAAVLRDQPAEAGGMNLDHTKSTDTGFLLPGFEDRGYFGHISFATL